MDDLFCTEQLPSVEVSRQVASYHPSLSVAPMVDPVIAGDCRVMGHMLEEEAASMLGLSDYCSSGRQPELKPHMRKIVTDWMLEVCEDQEAGPEVFLLAIHYLDTFLSTTTISRGQFQLVAATCLLLASKFSAVVGISALQLVLYTDHSVTVEELVQWELQVLAVLQWQLAAPTAHSLLEQLVARLPGLATLPAPQLARLQRHATSLATLAATEYRLLLAPRSVLAGAALTAAASGLGIRDTASLSGEVAAVLHCPREQVSRATSALESLLRPVPRLEKDCAVLLPTFHTLMQGNKQTNFRTTPTNLMEVAPIAA